MAKLFEIYAELALETGKFMAGINGAGKTAKAFASSLGSSVSATTVMMGNLMSSAVQKGAQYVKEFAGIGLEYNNTMETYVTNFKTMLGGSSEAAQKLTSDLETMAAKTPFAMSDLADATQTLLSFGQDSGTVLDTLQSLGDIAMGDASKLSSLTLAFAQASSSGKLMGQDLMQMINAGFNPLQSIIDRTGASMGDLKDFMSNGKASADLKKQMKAAQKEVNQIGNAASDGAKLLAQMAKEGVISAETLGMIFEMETSPGGRYYNAMQAASETFSGMLSTLQDDSAALLGKVFKPMTNWLKEEMIPKASQFIANVNKGFDVGGIKGAWSAAKGTIVGYLTEMGGAAYETGTNFLGKILTGLTGDAVTGEAIRDVIGDIWTDAKSGIDTLVTAGSGLLKGIYNGLSGDTEGKSNIITFFSDLWTDISGLASETASAVGGMLGAIYETATGKEATAENVGTDIGHAANVTSGTTRAVWAGLNAAANMVTYVLSDDEAKKAEALASAVQDAEESMENYKKVSKNFWAVVPEGSAFSEVAHGAEDFLVDTGLMNVPGLVGPLMAHKYDAENPTDTRDYNGLFGPVVDLISGLAGIREKTRDASEEMEAEGSGGGGGGGGDLAEAVAALSEAAAGLADAAASAAAGALSGAKVEMDGQTVGQLILPAVASGLARQYRQAAVAMP